MSNEWEDIHKKINQGKKITKSEAMQLINKVITNKVVFSKYMCGFDLSNRQVEMMEAMSTKPHTMGIFSRQSGKSTTFALWDAHELCFGKPPDGGEHWIISYGPTQRKAGRIAEILKSKIIRGNPIIEAYVETSTKNGLLILENGNKYEPRTASPNSEVEGDSPTVIQIDESQSITDKQYFEGIIPSGAATNAPIHEILTPGGRNHAYNTWISNDNSISKIKQPWMECPFIDETYVMRMKANSPPKKFAQEFMCEWNLDTGYAWNYHHIRAAAMLPYDNELPSHNRLYYSGIDIGKSPDKTVHWICEKTTRGLKTVYVNSMKDQDYTDSVPMLAKELIRYKPERTCIDAGGVGEGIFDYLKKEIIESEPIMRGWVRRRLTPIKLSNVLKHDMVGELDLLLDQNLHSYGDLLKATERNDIDAISYMISDAAFVMFNDSDMVTEMISFVKDTTKTGKHTYYAEEGQHDDFPIAVMMCVHAYCIDQKKKTSSGKSWASGGNTTMGSSNGTFTKGERIAAPNFTDGL